MKYKYPVSIVVRSITSVMLVIAIDDWPYSYYQALRVTAFLSAVFLIWYFNSKDRVVLGWIFCVPALLYNPFFPIYLDKQLWQVIDAVVSLQFVFSIGVEEDMKFNWWDEVGEKGVGGMVAGLVILVYVSAWVSLFS